MMQPEISLLLRK